MGQTHAVVAVGVATLARGAIEQVDVRRAVGRAARAVFGQVTRPGWPTAHCARLLQLSGRKKARDESREKREERIDR